jgi:hypothetical protein
VKYYIKESFVVEVLCTCQVCSSLESLDDLNNKKCQKKNILGAFTLFLIIQGLLLACTKFLMGLKVL